jgi:TrmH family RNA methyltransferase
MKVETLTSIRNPLLKSVRRAVARGELTAEGYAVAEGIHMLEEAVRSGREIAAVFISETARTGLESRFAKISWTPSHVLADALFSQISTTEATQGIITLVRPPLWTMDAVAPPEALAIVLDGIQEPGNAGAIVRAAEAFGATGVVYLKGTVNPYNPKSLRASAGSLFRLPCVYGVEDDAFHRMLAIRGLLAFAATPDGPLPVGDADFTRDCAIVIGSEGRGVRPEIARHAVAIRIPTKGVESLNAAVAAGVVLYEAQRQRRRQ